MNGSHVFFLVDTIQAMKGEKRYMGNGNFYDWFNPLRPKRTIWHIAEFCETVSSYVFSL